jgi:hypothetical protein
MRPRKNHSVHSLMGSASESGMGFLDRRDRIRIRVAKRIEHRAREVSGCKYRQEIRAQQCKTCTASRLLNHFGKSEGLCHPCGAIKLERSAPALSKTSGENCNGGYRG